MKKIIFLTFAVLTALVFTSCGGNNNTPQPVVVETKTYCHTELVYHPLASAVVAVPHRVQEGDQIGEIVQMHKTDPNQVGGPFLDYNLEMFLADNPELFSTIKRSIREDKCNPGKLDTVYYKAWNLKKNDLVYLRIPARIDTVETSGPNVSWFNPEKTTRVRQIIERSELFFNDISPKPVTDPNKNLCPVESEDQTTIPTPYIDVPVKSGNGGSGFCDFIGSIPNWLCLVAFIVLLWFIARQHKKTREAINQHTTEKVVADGEKTRTHVTIDGDKTRSNMSEVAKAITEQTVAVKTQTEAVTKSSKELLEAIRNQGGLTGGK